MFDRQKITVVSVTLALAMFAAACGKKKPPPPPPPPPQPITNTAPSRPPVNNSPAPVVASFSAEPTSIERGQSSTLRWEVSGDITGVSIDQTIGPVQNTGNRRVFPSNSTTYILTATGPGGSTTSSAIVTVTSPTAPPPPPSDATLGGRTVTEILESQVHDIYFDYDKSDISGDGRNTLTQDAAALKNMFTRFPNASIIVEGHCDERGSAEYNLGLGDRRSSSVMEFLVQLGVPADHLKPISYGKERPQCSESNESCFQKNRRVHFSPGQ